MKKFIALSAILFLIVSAVYFSSCKDSDKKSETKVDEQADTTHAKGDVVRGAYLFNHVAVCGDCHSQRDFAKYAGPAVPGTEGGGGFLFDEKLGLPGKIYGRNITPDNETGIGTWTDDEILKAITQGISKNGDTLFPLMPYPNFNHMAKSDLMSIIAYLRTLKPIRNKVPQRQLMMPIAMAYPGPMLKASIDSNMMPPVSDKVAYGGYLVTMADCGTCHSPLTQQGPDMSKMFAGGYTFDMGTFKVTSANISPDSATGIGSWTEAQFLEKMTKYREEVNYNFNPGKENTIMPKVMFSKMTDEDWKSIYAYLGTVKPANNLVVKYPK